ncbi:MAG TPA: methylated-DNA--[protein]-cysteine S-methyltransferase, partial [Caldimonas sp.]|nr:methylated-DNA--[protein]-cysteine S-methyltransferase [Caldimonas sp.]
MDPGYHGPMADAQAFAIFPTCLGDCAVAWNDIGLIGIWLPDESAARLRVRVARRCAGIVEAAPPPAVSQAIAAMTRLVADGRADLRDIRIDDSMLDAFDRRVCAAAREILPGRVLTYGQLAQRLGGAATARRVGESMARNRFPMVVPCHRVVASGGGLGGFSAPGGHVTKRRLLVVERARLDGTADLFDDPPPDGVGASRRSGSESG